MVSESLIRGWWMTVVRAGARRGWVGGGGWVGVVVALPGGVDVGVVGAADAADGEVGAELLVGGGEPAAAGDVVEGGARNGDQVLAESGERGG